jgi:amino-acid N-acetyltransferase
MLPLFRAAAAADQDAVESLLTSNQLPTAGVAEMFAQDPTQFIVAVDDDAVVAVAGVEECCEHALLRSVAVRPDWQRRGLGQELVARAVAQAESRGIAALYLLTLTAEHYFPRFGFARVERTAVPAAVASTVEFTSACPASAIPMMKPLVTT